MWKICHSQVTDVKDEKGSLGEMLRRIEDEGGVVDVMEESGGVVRSLVVQTKKMKQAISGASPSVVLLDTTFNFNAEGRDPIS